VFTVEWESAASLAFRNGGEHEWLNNYGVVEERDAEVILRSDGDGTRLTFDYLVVRLCFSP